VAGIEKRIKIINVISRLNIGGPSVHVVLLSKYINTDPFESLLISGSLSEGEGDMNYLLDDLSIRHLVISSLKREISPFTDLKSVIQLIKIFRREKPAIVHTNLAKAGIVGRLAAVLSGVPVVIHTFHGHIFSGYFSPLKSSIFVWIEKALSLFSTKIIVISKQIGHEICNVYRVAPGKKISVIPLGFELDKFESLDTFKGYFKKLFSIPSASPVLGIVGRITDIKNHTLFLKVAAEVFSEFPDAHFLVIGDGEKREEMEQLTNSLNLSSRVHFTGWVKEKAKIYADLDLLLLTSFNEGTPVTVIEAMYYGIPVVSTNVGGLPDLIDDKITGYLINSMEPAAFTGPIRALLTSDTGAEAIGRAAHISITHRYHVNRLIETMTDLYRQLLSEKRIEC
jgi:glycosyltransferase involved in cell wall biosynthesis